MKITATNLANIANGSYYLSNTTGEIKKAGIWQWVKCTTGLGDGRAKVKRLADAVKTSLLADAAIKSDARLTSDISALNLHRSLSSTDLKRIATRFKADHAEAIAKSDAFRLAETIVDDEVAAWVKNRSVCPDKTSLGFIRQLALYAARPVIDQAAKYADDPKELARRIRGKFDLMNMLLGSCEHMARQAGLKYPASETYVDPETGNKRHLTGPRFILDELHMRNIIACMFDDDGDVRMQKFLQKALAMPEEELQKRKEVLLSIPLAKPSEPGAVMQFASAARNSYNIFNETVVSEFKTKGFLNKMPSAVTSAMNELVDEMRVLFGETAIPEGKALYSLAEGKDVTDALVAIADEATKAGKTIDLKTFKGTMRPFCLRGAIKEAIKAYANSCVSQMGLNVKPRNNIGHQLLKRLPGLSERLEGCTSRDAVKAILDEHQDAIKDLIALQMKLEAHSGANIINKAAEKLAKFLDKPVDKVAKFASFNRLKLQASDLVSAIYDGKLEGADKPDFDIDAAFDKLVDDFVKERQDVFNEIDGLEGVSPKVKLAWKNEVLRLEKPAEAHPEKIAKLLATRLNGQLFLDAMKGVNSTEQAFAKMCDFASGVTAEFVELIGEEEWGDMGPDGRNPILTMTFIALLDKTPEIAAKFNEYRDVFTNPGEELDAKYLENGSVNAIAISNVLAPLIKHA